MTPPIFHDAFDPESVVDRMVCRLIQQHPTIFQCRTSVLHHLFFTPGNGYEWVDGRVVQRGESESDTLSTLLPQKTIINTLLVRHEARKKDRLAPTSDTLEDRVRSFLAQGLWHRRKVALNARTYATNHVPDSVRLKHYLDWDSRFKIRYINTSSVLGFNVPSNAAPEFVRAAAEAFAAPFYRPEWWNIDTYALAELDRLRDGFRQLLSTHYVPGFSGRRLSFLPDHLPLQ